MKTLTQLRDEITLKVESEIPRIDGQYTAEAIANWVLMDYQPVIEYEETPPNPDAVDIINRSHWLMKVRIMVGGRWVQMVGHFTDEAKQRGDVYAIERQKESMIARLGRAVAFWLYDGRT